MTLQQLLEVLGPELVGFGALLAVSFLAAFVATVVVPALPHWPVDEAAAPETAEAEPVPASPPLLPADPSRAGHWVRVVDALHAETARPATVTALHSAAARQVDAVEFALDQLCAEIAGVSSYARRRAAAQAPAPAAFSEAA